MAISPAKSVTSLLSHLDDILIFLLQSATSLTQSVVDQLGSEVLNGEEKQRIPGLVIPQGKTPLRSQDYGIYVELQ